MDSPARRTEVLPEDLQHLDVVHEILALLNEPAASAKDLAPLIARLPVLAARVDARYRVRLEAPASSPRGLSLIGNLAIESLLFELLEDLTILHAELELSTSS